MNRVACLFFLASVVSGVAAQEPLSLKVTILKLDEAAGTITLKRNGLQRDFLVNESTKLTFAGEQAKLADLKPGTEAMVLYTSATRPISSISVSTALPGDKSTNPVPNAPVGEESTKELSFQMVTELGNEPTTSLAVSSDGLQIYWEREGSTWGATRKDRKPTTPFENPQKRFAGRHLTFDGDTGVILLKRADRKHETLHSFQMQAGRSSRPREITSLVPPTGRNFSPYLALQGKLLCFSGRINGPFPHVYESKRSRDGSWQAPRRMLDDLKLNDGWTWPWLSQDGKTLIITNEGNTVASDETKYPHNIFIARRSSLNERFSGVRLLGTPGIDAMWCKAARYIPESRELFLLAQPRSEIRTPTFRIAVIRGVDVSEPK